jgi:5-formyltetrahydrofolate cyclo-ligase
MPNPEKQRLRKFYLDIRDCLPIKLRQKYSQQISQHLINSQIFKQASTIGLYCSFSSEVETEKLILAAMSRGKKVCLPTTNPETKIMSFSYYDGDTKNLVCNNLGLQEPTGVPIDPSLLDLIIVPGISFDLSGTRLGYGAGYYDRFLKTVSCPTIGLAFSVQIAKKLPFNSYDVRVANLATEEGLFSTEITKTKKGCAENE